MQSTNPQTHKSDSTVFKIAQKLGQFMYNYIQTRNEVIIKMFYLG